MVSERSRSDGGSASRFPDVSQVLGQSEQDSFMEQDQAVRAPKSAGDLWTIARVAVWSGRVKRLPASSNYDLVFSTFSALFPLEFDCVVPIFNCGAVETLLLQWNRTMTALEDVRTMCSIC